MRVPWTARRSNQSILKEISPEYSLEGLMLKLQYSGHLMQRTDSLKRPWCWERLKVGEGDDRGWDGWMASQTQWTWVWVNFGSWWWTGRPGVLQSRGSQRVRHDWATELNWSYSCCSVTRICSTLCDPTNCSTPCHPVSHHLPEFDQVQFIALVMPSSCLILWCPLLLLPWIFPSTRDFFNELSVYNRWPKYWSFSFIISPSSEYSGLISLKIYWFNLLAVQGTFRSLLQHHSSKASIFWHSALFIVQLSQPYVNTGKTIALTIWTFVGRIMSPFFNTLSRFVITFK